MVAAYTAVTHATRSPLPSRTSYPDRGGRRAVARWPGRVSLGRETYGLMLPRATDWPAHAWGGRRGTHLAIAAETVAGRHLGLDRRARGVCGHVAGPAGAGDLGLPVLRRRTGPPRPGGAPHPRVARNLGGVGVL